MVIYKMISPSSDGSTGVQKYSCKVITIDAVTQANDDRRAYMDHNCSRLRKDPKPARLEFLKRKLCVLRAHKENFKQSMLRPETLQRL